MNLSGPSFTCAVGNQTSHWQETALLVRCQLTVPESPEEYTLHCAQFLLRMEMSTEQNKEFFC